MLQKLNDSHVRKKTEFDIGMPYWIHVWYIYIHMFDFYGTPPKFNIVPQKLPSQKESSLPTIHFQGRTVKLWGGVNLAK